MLILFCFLIVLVLEALSNRVPKILLFDYEYEYENENEEELCLHLYLILIRRYLVIRFKQSFSRGGGEIEQGKGSSDSKV